MGYDLTYICIPDITATACDQTSSSCQYRIFLNRYYDCSGSTEDPANGNGWAVGSSLGGTFNFITSQPGCANPVNIVPWTASSYTEVTPVCPTAITSCQTTPFGQNAPSGINGVLESRFYSDWDFCAVNCNDYGLEWEVCCRNGIITSGAANQRLYAGSTSIDLSAVPCNSSPQFATTPVPYICSNQTFTFSQGAYDPDGDDLVFSLSPCFQTAGNQVTYGPGFAPTAPLGPNWTVTINATTGDITLTPNPGGALVGVLCVTVEEFRNGVKLGEVSRDIQVSVINCPANNYPAVTGVANPSGGTITGQFQLDACAGSEVCFDVLVNDPDVTDNLAIRSPNITLLDPNGKLLDNTGASVQVVTGPASTPPVARVCFTPPFAGRYYVIIDVSDDNCPLRGISQQTIEINSNFCGLIPSIGVARTSDNTAGNAIVDCYTVEFAISPNACNISYDYTIDPGDNSAPYTGNNSGSTLIYHSYPQTQGTRSYTYQISVVDAQGFRFDTTAIITIENNAVANAGPDVLLCSNVPGQIGVPGPAYYQYRWEACNSPGNPGLPSSPQNERDVVTVRLNNQLNVPFDIEYCLTAIDTFGCPAYDSVIVTFANKPQPDFVINNNFPEACIDEQAFFQYVGLRPAGIEYLWDFSSTSNGPNSPLGPGPHFASWPAIGSPTVSLQTVVRGCSSDVVIHPIEIKPIPVASFLLPTQVCISQSAVVSFNGIASPRATGTWTLDGGTVTQGDPNGLDPIAIQWTSSGDKIISLIVEDRNCISEVYRDTIRIHDIPTPDFNVLSPICQKDSMRVTYTGTASPNASYIWQFDGGQTYPATNGRQGPYTANWQRPGTKRICLQVQEHGCVSTTQCQPITVLPAPVATIEPVDDLCFDGGLHQVQFTYTGAPGMDTYQWFFGPTSSQILSTAATPPAITYSSPGVKTAKLVVSKDGCISDTAIVSFEVLADPNAEFRILTAGTVCSGDSVRVQRTGRRMDNTEVYSWNFGLNASPTISNLEQPDPIVYSSGGSKVITLTVTYGPGCEDTYAAQIRVEQSPSFTAGADLRFCEGTGGIRINASTTGGFPGYTWHWDCDASPACGLSSNAAEDPLVNPTGAGPDTVRYEGYAVDSKGCKSNTDPMRVIIDPKPIVSAGPDINLCKGGPGTQLQGGLHPDNRAAGPFSWEWRDDNGNTPPDGMTNYQQPIVYTQPLTTTAYTLVAVDQSTGCTSEATTVDPRSTAIVTVLPRPVAIAGPDTVVCFGNRINLRGAASGGQGNYSYQWSPDNPLVGFMSSPSAAQPSVGPFQTTTYSLIVSSSGCASSADEVTVVVHTIPTVDAGSDKVICFGDSVKLDGRASGIPQNAAGYTFSWTPSIGLDDDARADPMTSPIFDQNYQLKVVSDFGCGSAIDDVNVTVNAKPVADILSNDTVLCEGDELRLVGIHRFSGAVPPNPNVLYDWAPGQNILGDNRASTVQAKPTETTVYVLTTTLGACSSTDEVLVSVLPGITAAIEVSDTVICSGEMISLTGSGGNGNASFTWDPPFGILDPAVAQTEASPTQSVTYRLVLEEGACKAEELIFIKVNKTPVADYFSSETKGCEGLEVSFVENAADGLAYIWDFGDGSVMSNEENPIHRYATAGEYPVTLRVIGEGACESSITKETISVSAGPTSAFVSVPETTEVLYLPLAEVQFLNESSNATSFFWDFGDGNFSEDTEPIHAYDEPGEYEVSLTAKDEHGCTSTFLMGLYDVRLPGLTIPNIFTPNGDGFNDDFQIIYEGKEAFFVEVFDRWGRKYFASNSPMIRWNGSSPEGKTASAGAYFYSVQIGNNAFTGNVTLMR